MDRMTEQLANGERGSTNQPDRVHHAGSGPTMNGLFRNEMGNSPTQTRLCGFVYHTHLIAFLNVTLLDPSLSRVQEERRAQASSRD